MSEQIVNVRLAMMTTLLGVSAVAMAQKTITGTVKDATGEPLIGVSVMVEGTSNGSVTDFDGNFTIQKVANNATLKVSYVGYQDQKVSVANGTKFDIVMKEDQQQLEELVVIGYGSVRRKDITGAVATVDSKALTAAPVASASEAITGKLAGVQVSTSEGSPDATVKIRVRGGGSITQSNDPLFIVDGFPVDDISNIPSSDIEDITVLKDASSTAIYGSRGANGVILVTTKSGKEGKVNVSYNAYHSWKKVAHTYDVLSPGDYTKWQYELSKLSDNESKYTSVFGNYQDLDLYNNVEANDWQDMTYGRTGTTFNQNLNINGGSESIKYAFSYAHMNDKAIMIGSGYKRDNFSLKLNTKPSKKTTLDFQARYSETDIDGGGANDQSSTLNTDKRLKDAIIYPPIPLKGLASANASFDDDDLNLYDPITSANDNYREKERKNLNIAGSFGWEIFKNFKIKTEYGYDTYNEYDKRFWGTTAYYVRTGTAASTAAGKPAIRFVDTNRRRFRNTNTVSYDFKDLLKDTEHTLNAMLGHEYVITKKRALTSEVHGFPTDYDAQTAWRLSSQGTPYTIDDNYSAEDKLLSYFGRLNYSFKERYLATFTMRADESSKFAEGNRWGYFPSVALAWRISSESWMKNTESWLDDLKLRLSYGTAGNNNIPTGQLVQLYENKATGWINGIANYWAPSKTMANPDLKWETTITRNIGLDWTVFGGKLNGSFEYYNNTTKDLLIQFPTAGTGYDDQYRNMGETQNSGFEFSFTYHIVDKKDWGIDFNGNIGFNKNKVKDLGDMNDFGWQSYWASSRINNDYKIAVGSQLGTIIGHRLDGNGRYELSDFVGYDEEKKMWTLKEGVADASSIIGHSVRPGDMKLVDEDGDGVIDDKDNVEIGKVAPKAYGGFGLSARAYGFDLTAQFSFALGNKVYNANKIEYTSADKYFYRNLTTEMADGNRWTNIDPTTGEVSNDAQVLAALNANTTMWSPYVNHILTDWAVEDASFLRLNTLSLGYTVPKTVTSKLGLSSLRFYCTAYNVFCWTKYTGSDPEADTVTRTALTPSIDYSGYPKSRSFTVGLNLNF